MFTLLEKQSYILGHFFQLHTGSSDIIIMGPYASTNTIHQHHKVSRRDIMLWKFITCKSLWSFGLFSAHLAVRGVMLVRDREVCARPPSSMNPKSILGTLGVTMGPYPKHAMSSVHVDSDKHFMSILSFSEFSYLNCDHYSQADRFRMVHYVTDRAGFHPCWF